jgi:hypothetical protein
LSPAGGEVGVGYLANNGERHLLIIRFGTHSYLITDRMSSMQSVGGGAVATATTKIRLVEGLFPTHRDGAAMDGAPQH